MAETHSNEFGTVIGADATFKGDLQFDSAAKVLGRIEGSITSKGRIHIAEGAECKATVTGKEVAIEGHVQGNVEASDRVELKPKGMITGDITASRMTMADGAAIDGHCRIGVDGKAGSPGKGATSAEVKPSGQPSGQPAQQKAAAKS